ncbi:MAG TPA: LacI family transcriptional regulator, partial [Firmicutes bacterium]|nr:LacI family transcriptional regulator [Bacillota bacterium]
MAGIKEVAKHAGVAIGTVSRVINNNSTVNPKIREKVLKSIEELNYVPDEVARSFKLRTTKMVALLVPTIWNPFFSELGHYVEDELDKRGYKLLLCNSGAKPEKEQYYLEMLNQNKVAGILGITYNEYEEEFTKDIPFVSIDRVFSKEVPCVSSDNYQGGQIAADELINAGCKKLAFMGSFTKINTEVNRRKEGFVAQAKKRGQDVIVFEKPDPIENVELFCNEFHEQHPDVDGVFA